jgi:hypothetical protein
MIRWSFFNLRNDPGFHCDCRGCRDGGDVSIESLSGLDVQKPTSAAQKKKSIPAAARKR